MLTGLSERRYVYKEGKKHVQREIQWRKKKSWDLRLGGCVSAAQ